MAAGGERMLFLPPLCSTPLTCIFIAKVGRETLLMRLTVEECGVEWGAVE